MLVNNIFYFVIGMIFSFIFISNADQDIEKGKIKTFDLFAYTLTVVALYVLKCCIERVIINY